MSKKGFAEHFNEGKKNIDLKNSAILVVDVLNDFVKEGGAMVLDDGHVIIPHLKKLLDEARKKDIPVIYINDNHRPNKYDSEFDKRVPHCIDGTWGADVIDEIKPEEGDYIVKKRRYSGFFQTDLHLILSELKVNTVIVTGLVTNICVRSTIHDAFFLGYDVLVPKQCVRATGPREQESTLWDIETHFGYVKDVEEVINIIKRL